MKTEEQIFTNTLFEVEDLIRHNCELESHDNTGMSCQYSKAIAALNDGLIKMYTKALQDSKESPIKKQMTTQYKQSKYIRRRTNMLKTEGQIITNTLFEVEDLIRHNCELESHDNTSMSCQYSKAIAALNDGLIKMYTKALQNSKESTIKNQKDVHIKKLTPKETEYLKSMQAHGYFELNDDISAEDLRALMEALAYTE